MILDFIKMNFNIFLILNFEIISNFDNDKSNFDYVKITLNILLSILKSLSNILKNRTSDFVFDNTSTISIKLY